MKFLKICTCIILFKTLYQSLKCPNVLQLKLHIIKEAVSVLSKDYKDAKKIEGQSYNMAQYCLDFYQKLTKDKWINKIVSAKSRRQTAFDLSIKENTLIKNCMNSNFFDHTVAYKFAIEGLRFNDLKSTSPYKPYIEDIFYGSFSAVVVVSFNGQKLAIKVPSSENTATSKSIDLQTYNTVSTVKRLSEDSSVSSSHFDSHINQSARSIIHENIMIALLRTKPAVQKYFINTCYSQVNKYPEDIVVMEYGGKTLFDYYVSLTHEKTAIIDFEDKIIFYRRLFKIFLDLELNNISYCDFKPENLLFDQKDLENTRLIDIGSISKSSDKCKAATSVYAPPEYFRDRRNYNNYMKVRNVLLYDNDVNEQLSIIYRFIGYIKMKIQLLDDHIKKSKITSFSEAEYQARIIRLTKMQYNWEKIAHILYSKETNDFDNKDLMHKLEKEFDNFFIVNGFSRYILETDKNKIKNSKGFDVYSLGVLVMEFELYYLKYTYGIRVKDTEDRYRSPYSLLNSVLLEYNSIQIENIKKENVLNNEVMTTVDKINVIYDIIKIADNVDEFSYNLLNYINHHILLEISSRDQLYEFYLNFEKILDNTLNKGQVF